MVAPVVGWSSAWAEPEAESEDGASDAPAAVTEDGAPGAPEVAALDAPVAAPEGLLAGWNCLSNRPGSRLPAEKAAPGPAPVASASEIELKNRSSDSLQTSLFGAVNRHLYSGDRPQDTTWAAFQGDGSIGPSVEKPHLMTPCTEMTAIYGDYSVAPSDFPGKISSEMAVPTRMPIRSAIRS